MWYGITMPDRVTTFNGYIDAAVAALGTGDHATARRSAVQAGLVLSSIPDAEISDGMRIAYRDNLRDVMREIERLERDTQTAAAQGMRRTTVTYVGPTS